MAVAHVNIFDTGDPGGYGRGLPVSRGYGRQTRIDIASLPTAFPATPQGVVGEGGLYAQLVSDVRIKAFVGPAALSEAERQSRACVFPAGATAVMTEPGHVIHVWSA